MVGERMNNVPACTVTGRKDGQDETGRERKPIRKKKIDIAILCSRERSVSPFPLLFPLFEPAPLLLLLLLLLFSLRFFFLIVMFLYFLFVIFFPQKVHVFDDESVCRALEEHVERFPKPLYRPTLQRKLGRNLVSLTQL